MTAMLRTALVTLAAALLIADAASAAEPKSLGQFRDWEAFSATEDGRKVCYALTKPTKSEGDYTRRDPAYLMVTRRPGENVFDEVSAIAGYTYQKNSNPELSVKRARFVADAVEDVAWPRVSDSRKLVAAMRAGADLELKGTSSRGTLTRDVFSLRGFTAALKAIQGSCPRR